MPDQSYRIIPVYSGDVSGVASALYELSGMTVIDDPSGCNSTYNTHDEIRWYDEESLIFISGLSDIDAIVGNDDKFVNEVVEAAEYYHPAFICLCSSPVPFLNGTDFRALSELIEKRTGIPTFFVATNGMHDYTHGVNLAFEALANSLFNADDTPKQSVKNGVAVLGVTPLDFAAHSSVESLNQKLSDAGFDVIADWAMKSSLDALRASKNAAVSLVVSSCGLSAAKALEKRFGIPYVVGAPVGAHTDKCLKALGQTMSDGKNRVSYFVDGFMEEDRQKNTNVIIGESVVSSSIAAHLQQVLYKPFRVMAATETTAGLLRDGDLKTTGEADLEQAIQCAKIIVADPLYRPICPKGAQFVPLSQLAFSGRIYLDTIPDLFAPDFQLLHD